MPGRGKPATGQSPLLSHAMPSSSVKPKPSQVVTPVSSSTASKNQKSCHNQLHQRQLPKNPASNNSIAHPGRNPVKVSHVADQNQTGSLHGWEWSFCFRILFRAFFSRTLLHTTVCGSYFRLFSFVGDTRLWRLFTVAFAEKTRH